MTDLTLGTALAGLLEVAAAAGVEQDTARAEGEDLAAAVAEPAVGAWEDWNTQTGGGRDAEAFAAAVSRGRRYRSAPTPTMATLSLSGSPRAPEYARALADVALAACSLGEQTSRVLGNATTATAAQLGEVRSPAPPDAPVASPPGEEDPAGQGERAEHFLGQVMTQIGVVRDRIDALRRDPMLPPTAGSSLDLGGDVPAHGPGAFSLDGSGVRRAPNTPAGPTPTNGPSTGPSAAEPAAPAATDPAAADADAEAEPEPEPEPKTVAELLAELDGLVGLAEVKAEIHRQSAVLRMEGMREKAGLSSPTITRHLVFTGNPGTGKTTVARLVAGIYRALGLLSKGHLVEVDRSELVAGYLGQTAIKTAEVVAGAEGGVLFVDEAYSLTGDQYGTEAVDTLVKEMEDRRGDLVVIVAGYPVPMELFIAQNPGLASRFRTTIEFEDYTDDELVEIFRSMVTAADYDADDDVLGRVRTLLAGQPRDSTFGNARFVRNLLEAAVGRHAWRLRDVAEPTLAQLRTLRTEDLDVPVEEIEPAVPVSIMPGSEEAAPEDATDSPATLTGDTDETAAPRTGETR